jgi:hypothetical protein
MAHRTERISGHPRSTAESAQVLLAMQTPRPFPSW